MTAPITAPASITLSESPIPLEPLPDRGGPVDDFIDRLSHPTPGKATGWPGAIFQCLISFGIVPLLIWPTRWSEFLETEQRDLTDLASWWRRRVDPTQASKLDRIVSRLGPSPLITVLAWLVACFNVLMLVSLFCMGDDIHRLWHLTFSHQLHPVFFGFGNIYELESRLYFAWVFTLSAAYALHWLALRSHVRAVNALVNWTNRVARDNRFARIDTNTTRSGMNIAWIAIAVGLALHHAWWGIPMAFAGAQQRVYSAKISPAVRMAMAAQVRSGYAAVRSVRDRFCSAAHCGARLPAPARFCPRCGTGIVQVS